LAQVALPVWQLPALLAWRAQPALVSSLSRQAATDRVVLRPAAKTARAASAVAHPAADC
jgi:hypothetical protein